MWIGWKALVLSPHHVKFGGHWHCGSGDMFLVAEEQDCACSPKSDAAFSEGYDMSCPHTHEIAGLRHSYLLSLFRL